MKRLYPIILSLALTAIASAQSGTWTKKSHSIDGTWEITSRNNQKVLVLKGLKTKSAPDLKLFFSKKTLPSLNGKNATNGATRIALLKSNKGNQEYIIPNNLNPADYKSLIIHCEKYSKLWGGSSL